MFNIAIDKDGGAILKYKNTFYKGLFKGNEKEALKNGIKYDTIDVLKTLSVRNFRYPKDCDYDAISHACVLDGYVSVLKSLKDNDINLNYVTLFKLAVENKQIEVIEYLLSVYKYSITYIGDEQIKIKKGNENEKN